MATLDDFLLSKACDKFQEDFEKQIKNLGYGLCHGNKHVNGQPVIFAGIHDYQNKGFTQIDMEQIENILPKEYIFDSNKFPVKIGYLSQITSIAF